MIVFGRLVIVVNVLEIIESSFCDSCVECTCLQYVIVVMLKSEF